jgi:hypothetical protein
MFRHPLRDRARLLDDELGEPTILTAADAEEVVEKLIHGISLTSGERLSVLVGIANVARMPAVAATTPGGSAFQQQDGVGGASRGNRGYQAGVAAADNYDVVHLRSV